MSSDRTEKPTAKRREDARRKGQIARRPELPAAASFLAALGVLQMTGGELLAHSRHLLSGLATWVSNPEPLTIAAAHGMMIAAVGNFALLALPVTAALLITSLAGNFAQGGFTLSSEALKPRADRFNPAANWKRVFSLDRPVELLKQCLVIGCIGAVCYGVFMRAVENAAALVGTPAPAILTAGSTLLAQLGWRAGAVLLVLAALDYGYGWYKHERSLRMSKQELKDEFRQQEGDPFVKAHRRRAARALALRQIVQEVPQADVVVTNPTHFAVALRYDRQAHAAPMVVAKGADLMAKRIRDIAKSHRVPIIENPPLARALYKKVDVRGSIPPEFFRAVAELLAYVYRQRDKAASSI